jgi:lipoprotein NlpD
MNAGRTALLVAVLLAVTACSKALRWTPETYTVRPGDTLYSIALNYGVNYRELAAWNRLGDGAYIRQGQVLRLRPPAATAARQRQPAPAPEYPAPTWRWPTAGPVAVGYAAAPKTQSGVRIAGRLGQPVLAVAAGEVVYAGDGLPSYGLLLIIKHNETWLSAYGLNSRLRVAEGDKVAAGQVVAEMGQARPGEYQLHFEIRRAGQPVNPVALLPAR